MRINVLRKSVERRHYFTVHGSVQDTGAYYKKQISYYHAKSFVQLHLRSKQPTIEHISGA